jgi:ketosteroid isomerase-like protein
MIALALITSAWMRAEAPRSADQAAIQAQLTAYAAARQIGDGAAQALFYAEDADEWGSGAKEMSKGRAEIAKTLTATPDPKRRFRLEPVNFGFPGNDVALVDALYFGAASAPYGHALYVMVKRDGKWLIRSARMTRFPPPAAK